MPSAGSAAHWVRGCVCHILCVSTRELQHVASNMSPSHISITYWAPEKCALGNLCVGALGKGDLMCRALLQWTGCACISLMCRTRCVDS